MTQSLNRMAILNPEENRWVELISRFPADPRAQLERELRITEAILNPRREKR